MTNEERDQLIRQIHASITDVSAKLSVTCDVVARHDRSLYGNGRPGVCTRLDQVQTIQKDCPARAAKRPANVIAALALLVAVLAAIAPLLAKFIS